jgi:alanine racemase
MQKNIPYIEISLDNLLHNLAGVRSRLPKDAAVLAVVKDNAYGCGSRVIAQTLEQKGAVRFFAVRSPAEAFISGKKGSKARFLSSVRRQKPRSSKAAETASFSP